MSAVPPTLFEAAPLLLAGEVGCSFRPLTLRVVEDSFSPEHFSHLRVAIRCAHFPAGELGCNLSSLCSPSSEA